MRMTALLLVGAFLILVPATQAGEIGVPDNNPKTGAACNAIPFNSGFMGGEARYQALVPASMLGGKPFIINELSFASCTQNAANLVANPCVITFAHTTQTKLSPTYATNLAKDATVVLNGPIAYVGTYQVWTPIGLTGTFLYNGVDNLVVEVKYKAATGGFSCYRSSNIERGYTIGAGAYTSTTGSVGSMAALKMQFKFPDIRLTLSGSPTPGGTVGLDLFAPGDAGLRYQLASSLGTGPIPLGNRQIDLTPDDLMVLTTGNFLPTVFVDFSGQLDSKGEAKAKINILNDPVLIGVRFYTAFVTLDPRAPFGIKSISRTEPLTIMK